jgi:hypothetical protein
MLAALAGVALVGACAVHLSAFPLVAESEIRTFAASIHLKTEKTDMTAPSGFADTIRLSAPARTPARARAGASRVAAKPESTEAPFQPSIAETRIVPAENEITSLTGARTFQGVYPIAQPPVRAASGQPPPWQVAANAGAGIGAAAKKASVGLATTFSRAGVSIGRSF